MSGKKLLFKYFTSKNKEIKGDVYMSIGEYFEILKYVLMTATFVALILIFLYVFYGKEEKEG